MSRLLKGQSDELDQPNHKHPETDVYGCPLNVGNQTPYRQPYQGKPVLIHNIKGSLYPR